MLGSSAENERGVAGADVSGAKSNFKGLPSQGLTSEKYQAPSLES